MLETDKEPFDLARARLSVREGERRLAAERACRFHEPLPRVLLAIQDFGCMRRETPDTQKALGLVFVKAPALPAAAQRRRRNSNDPGEFA